MDDNGTARNEMEVRKDLETLFDIELFAGRAGVELGHALQRLQDSAADGEAIALVELARDHAVTVRKQATALIKRIRDRERKKRSKQ